MATINGTFNSLIAGTLSGTVATPGATGPAGPAGPTGPQGVPGTPGVGVPVGGTAGQVLAKVDGVDYNTEWIDQSAPDFISSVSAPLAVTTGNLTINLAGYATETFVTSQGYITSAALSPYLLSSTAASTYRALTNNTFGLVEISAASNLGFIAVNPYTPFGEETQSLIQFKGLVVRDASTTAPIAVFAADEVLIPPVGITFSDYTVQTSAGVSMSVLADYAQLAGATFTGKANFTSVGGDAGLNIGIGGTSTDSTTNGDLWIATGGVSLNYRDGNGAWRIVAVANSLNTFSSPQIINTTSTTTALRVTQAGTGNALIVEDSTTPDTSALVVDASGNVGIGVAAGYTSTAKLEVVGNVKGTTLSTGSGPTFSINSTAAHTGGSSSLDALVTINGVNYRIALRPA